MDITVFKVLCAQVKLYDAAAEKYIDSLVEDTDKITAKKYCDNRCANIVLSYYSKITADKGIRFETNVTLHETLVVDETDLVGVTLQLQKKKDVSSHRYIRGERLFCCHLAMPHFGASAVML